MTRAMDKAIEAAARIIDPLAFEEQGSCPPRGYECHTPEQLSCVIAARRRRAVSVAKRMIAAYQAANGEARDKELEHLRQWKDAIEALEKAGFRFVMSNKRWADIQAADNGVADNAAREGE